MEESVVLEDLPVEIIEEIVTFLSAEDLTRCLAVSRSWYNVFCNDMFWKRFLTADLSNYLSETKCLVEPVFKPPIETYSPIFENRLKFLQEQHFYKNWHSLRYKEEEIDVHEEYYGDEDLKQWNNFRGISFFDNNHVCLHFLLTTEVWNVTETPFLVMTIPYYLKEGDINEFTVIENTLVVMCYTAVQIYNIDLDSNSWSLNQIFFYNKPGDFLSNVTGESDVNDLFELEDLDWEDFSEGTVCGEYFLGSYAKFQVPSFPVLHVWKIKTGEKLKEEICDFYRESWLTMLTEPKENTKNEVLVTFYPFCELPYCSIIYDISQLKFVMPSQCYHSGRAIYFDGYLSVLGDGKSLIMYNYGSIKKPTTFKQIINIPAYSVTSVQRLGGKLLISTKNEVYSMSSSEMAIGDIENFVLIKVEFKLSHMEVLFDRYVVLFCGVEDLKEIWESGESLKKVVELPSNSYTSSRYLGRNNVCSKIILENGNKKLFVLNVW